MHALANVVRYLHYTLGITTPRPEQERMFVVIWIVSSAAIAAMSAGFFLLLLSMIHAQ